MPSKEILKPAQRHEAFLRSPYFAPELARIPFKWRNRVITAAMAKMAWSSWYRVYESIATSFVREFAEQYVPAGVDLSQSDADIVATAERAAAGVTKMLWMAVSDTHALQIMEDECASYGIELPEFEALFCAVPIRAIQTVAAQGPSKAPQKLFALQRRVDVTGR